MDNSCRFTDASYLYRTPGSSGNRTTWKYSTFIKKTEFGAGNSLITAGTDASNYTQLRFDTSNRLELRHADAGSLTVRVTTTQVFRDPSAHMLIEVEVDTTDGTSTDRVRIYINKVRVTDFAYSTFPSASKAMDINHTVLHRLCQATWAAGYHLNGYLSETCLTDGESTSERATDKNGVIVPSNLSGLTYGTNGFYLDFADSSALGNDVSGNNNDFTASGLTASDQMIDTPTNNFATLNPLDISDNTVLSDGNLDHDGGTGTTVWRSSASTMGQSTGKWYAEVYCVTTAEQGHGIQKTSVALDNGAENWIGGTGFEGYGMYKNGAIYHDGGSNSYTTLTVVATDIIGIALDCDNDTVEFYYNGTGKGTFAIDANSEYRFGVATAGTTGRAQINFGQDSTFSGRTTAGGNADGNGIGDFKYSVPSGFLALCSANLPEPTIGPNSAIKPSDCFATVLYTGNGTAIGSGGNAITGVGFQPDMVWIKNRDAADRWMCFDSVRGATKYISLDRTDAEVTNTETLNTFDADGFTLGSNAAVNTNTEDYVAYCFKITAGFFDIQSYTGTGVAKTEAHDLGVAPNMMAVKNLASGYGHLVYCESLPVTDPETDYMYLDLSNAVADAPTIWNSTAPTSSVFSVGTNGSTNLNTGNFIAYLFADIEGFCKTGYYEGNGSTDGAFEYLGFDPSFHVIKRTDTNGRWDTRMPSQYNNQVDNYLRFDKDDAETSAAGIDGLSNGVKQRDTNEKLNESGGDYITLSIGGNTIKYSNAR